MIMSSKQLKTYFEDYRRIVKPKLVAWLEAMQEDERKASKEYFHWSQKEGWPSSFAQELIGMSNDESRHSTIITRMLQKMRMGFPVFYVNITSPGNTIFTIGSIVSYDEYVKESRRMVEAWRQDRRILSLATGEPILRWF